MDPIQQTQRAEGIRPPGSALPDLPAAVLGGALARLSSGPDAAPAVTQGESLKFATEVHEAAPMAHLEALQNSLRPPSLWARPQVTRALTLGSMLVGCAVGAYTLGGAGVVLALAAEVMAFASGLLSARSELSRLKEENQRLKHQAEHDALTGLNNRGSIDAILRDQLQRAPFRGGSVSVIVADVDHFKKVNDSYGHQVGDEVLIEVAQRVRGAVRDQDSVGRYGGEELLIVLPGLGGAQAVLVAQRIRQAVGQRPFRTQAGELQVTMSLGVASTDYPHLIPSASLVQAADEALYRAKNEGRNRVVVSPLP